MHSDNLPDWMVRTPDETYPKKMPSDILMISLMFLSAFFIALSISTVIVYPEAFYLPVIASGVTILALMMTSHIRLSMMSAFAFVLSAILANIVIVSAAELSDTNLSGDLAIASTVLFSGLVGIHLFSRSEKKPSRADRVILTVSILVISALIVAIYFTMPHGYDISDGIIRWTRAAMVPMIVIIIEAFLISIAHHRSEVTLPSDRWM